MGWGSQGRLTRCIADDRRSRVQLLRSPRPRERDGFARAATTLHPQGSGVCAAQACRIGCRNIVVLRKYSIRPLRTPENTRNASHPATIWRTTRMSAENHGCSGIARLTREQGAAHRGDASGPYRDTFNREALPHRPSPTRQPCDELRLAGMVFQSRDGRSRRQTRAMPRPEYLR